MTAHEVTCITLNTRIEPYERITHVGGHDPRGHLWRLTVNEAIKGMMDGRWEFFVTVSGLRHSLRVAYSPTGHRYLKAEDDHDEPATLLALVECGSN